MARACILLLCLVGIGCGTDSDSGSPEPGPAPGPTATPTPDGDDGTDTGDPDFTIQATPDKLNVPQGGDTDIHVTVTRVDGFSEPIEVTVDGMPDGIEATPLTLAAGETSGTITLSAASTIAVPHGESASVRGHTSDGTRSDPITLTVRGAPGSPDGSFGTAGVSTIITQLFDVDEQSDGRLVVAGWDWNDSLVVCRLHADGSADTSFGSDGCAGGLGSPEFGVEVILDGSDVRVVGQTEARTFVARFDDRGALDPTFGSGGVMTIGTAGTSSRPYAAIDDDGATLITGVWNDSSDLNGFVARVDAEGTLDGTFGDAGKVRFTGPIATDLVRLGNGRIVVSTANGYELHAFTEDGKVDSAFGSGGVVTLPESGKAVAKSGGDILAAGSYMHVTRVSASGAIVATYPGLTPSDAAQTAWAEDVTVLANGTMLLGGTMTGGGDELAIGRRLPDGSPDDSFAPGGVRAYDSGTQGNDVEVLGDGRYLLVGSDFPEAGILLRVWD